MLRQLAEGERNLSELAKPFKMSFPAASKHVRVLERAELVERRIVGREHLCRINAAPMREVAAWIENYRQFWEQQFDRLDDYLQELQHKETNDATKRRKKKRRGD